MQKPAAISLIIIALVIGSASYLFLSKNNNKSQTESSLSQDSANSQNGQLNFTAGGQYIDYDEQKLAQIKGEKYLFFHAPWCPQCRSIEQGIFKGPIPKDITIVKVDYDTSQNLKQKYGVTLQTTFVKVDDNGELIDKYVAYDQPTFEAVLKNFILQ